MHIIQKYREACIPKEIPRVATSGKTETEQWEQWGKETIFLL